MASERGESHMVALLIWDATFWASHTRKLPGHLPIGQIPIRLGADQDFLWLHRGGYVERRQIEYFLAVIDHGGVTAAATALHISQPALSAAIKMLEKDLGAMLFHRLPRGVKLTDAGAEFAESARVIIREFDTARARVEAVTGLIAGQLDMISLPGMVLDPLAPVIGEFRRQYPKVRVRLVQADTPEEVRDAVRSGAAELGLTDELAEANRDVLGELVAEQEMVA